MSVSPKADPLTSVPFAYRVATFIAVVTPIAVLVAVGYGLWGWGLFWTELVVMIGMYTLAALGTTVGFHRLFTHRAFDTYGWVKFLLAALGSMAVQGPLIRWVAIHRRHHQHSDAEDDPHSPHRSRHGKSNLLSGIYHAHLGWLFRSDAPGLDRYVQDLSKDKSIKLASDLFAVWALMGLLIPAAIGGWISGSWYGFLLGFLWGGLVRMFVGHHVTWSINSVCHLWGTRPFNTGDESRNNLLFGLLAFGEGWHNNHHAYPTSARHGFHWWQIDLSYALIRALEFVGLAWQVRVPQAIS